MAGVRAMIVERIWARLMRNIDEPENEQACWLWRRRADGHGYGIIDIHTPGLGRNATLKPHIVAWLLIEAPEHIESADDLYLAYKELTTSGTQLDHSCVSTCCINPNHLTPVSHIENTQLRDSRRKAKTQKALFIYA